MRIGIDARVLDRPITGTGRYLLNILNELPNQDNENEYYLFSGSVLPVDGNFYKIINYKKTIVPYKIYSPYYFNVVLPKLLKEYDIDILFSPNILCPIVKLPGVKRVTVIHDAIPWVYPEYYPFFYKKYLAWLVPPSLRKSDMVITVSEHSKKDLMKFFNLTSEKIHVIYNTASEKFQPISKDELKSCDLFSSVELPDKYLLYVGVVEPRKNVNGLIMIFDALCERGSKLGLVIIGKPGYNNQPIMREIEKRKERITYIPYLNDDPLIYAFNKAFAFIFPSYYEGFGIPPLEAMQCGIPVLSSNASALEEVVGSGGLLHHPDNHNGFVEEILKLENNNDFYNLMKLKALENAKKFNIKETTEQLVNIFNEVGTNKE